MKGLSKGRYDETFAGEDARILEYVYEMEYCDVTMKTRTKLYRNIGVHTKPLKWSKHSQQLKLWVFLQYIGRELHYSH